MRKIVFPSSTEKTVGQLKSVGVFQDQGLKVFGSDGAKKHNTNTLWREVSIAVNTSHLFLSLEIHLRHSFPVGAAELLFQCLSQHDIILMSDCRHNIVSGHLRMRPTLVRGNSAIQWSPLERKSHTGKSHLPSLETLNYTRARGVCVFA